MHTLTTFYRDIAFAAVHDSYWTHASTVDRMNEILRQQVDLKISFKIKKNLKLVCKTAFTTFIRKPKKIF